MSLKNEINKLANRLDSKLENSSWSDFRETISNVHITEEQFLYLCENPDSISELCSNRYWNWNWQEFVINNLTKYPSAMDKILKNSSCPRIIYSAMESGVTSVDKYNVLAQSKNSTVREYAVNLCDFKTLDALSEDRSKKVRKLALTRLGPSTHLDSMLKDKHAEIRSMGVAYAPFAYPKLDEMVGEISRQVFMPLIKKIRKESLPLLLSNRNLKESYVMKMFENRMSSGR
tara:strand:+ start:25513 stop:26205 length:693 start_codon:yes stop_codon:yes gene_type:complete